VCNVKTHRPISELHEILVLYDGEEITMADDYADIPDPHNDDSAEYLVLTDTEATQVLVSIPYFSPHTITIMLAQTEQQEPFSLWIVAAIVGVPVLGIALMIYFSKIRKSHTREDKNGLTYKNRQT